MLLSVCVATGELWAGLVFCLKVRVEFVKIPNERVGSQFQNEG